MRPEAKLSSAGVLDRVPLGPPSSRARVRRRVRRELLTTVAQIGPATLFLAVFLMIPLFVFFLYSFWKTQNYTILHDWTGHNYQDVASDPVYRTLLLNTGEIAFETTIVATLVGYAFAHAIRFHLRRQQRLLLFVVMVAMFSGYLVRIYAWRTILGDTGIVNALLQDLGVIHSPLTFLLYSRAAAIIVLSNFLVPLALLPIYAALENVSDDEVEAARDLGCGAWRALWKVTLPLAWRGVFAAGALCFIVASGDYVTPELVGGTSGSMVGRAISTAFTSAFDWPGGAALAFITLAVTLAVIGVLRFVSGRVVR